MVLNTDFTDKSRTGLRVNLPNEQLMEIDAISEITGLTKSQVIEAAIALFITADEADQKVMILTSMQKAHEERIARIIGNVEATIANVGDTENTPES